MNAAEYQAYQARVEAFLDRAGIYSFTTVCDETSGERVDHDEFSHRPCDCCGTTLGGARTLCDAMHERTREVVEVSACDDCIYFVAYGQLDDETMMRMEGGQ
jgi:hypothetical protein